MAYSKDRLKNSKKMTKAMPRKPHNGMFKMMKRKDMMMSAEGVMKRK